MRKHSAALFWLKDDIPNPEEKGLLGKVHEGLYKNLRSMCVHTPSKVVEDCYGDTHSNTRVDLTTQRGRLFLRRKKEC
ncbi:hypothetical protein [Sulfuracidifex metallicus]|uniref:hypothetical protein n=1 Tax=Sulfuracidifex metallicus TaxID=47303 RepID=UPI0030B87846